jgi:hypothetical protein
VLPEKLKKRGPVNAAISPPMAGSRLLVVGEISVKLTQCAAYSTGFAYGDVVISIAVEDVDPEVASVLQECQGIA